MDEVWLFAVITIEDGILVIFTPEDYWLANHQVFDGNVDEELEGHLPPYLDDEVEEATFLIPHGFPVAQILLDLEVLGYKHDSVFEDYCFETSQGTGTVPVRMLAALDRSSGTTASRGPPPPTGPLGSSTSRWERLLKDDPFKKDDEDH